MTFSGELDFGSPVFEFSGTVFFAAGDGMALDFFNTVEEEHKRLREVTRWISDVAIVLALALFVVHFLGNRYTIMGNSMSPVLENGNVVFINELCYNFLEPARLDVVLFESAEDESRTFVKRIIGLPGETVQIVDGAVLIDGEAASLPDGLDLAAIPGLAKDPVTLEENEYFMLGDNRDSSEDSRFVNVGKVNRSQIVGKVWLRVSPLSELGLIQ